MFMIEQIEKKLKMDKYDLESVFSPAMVNIIITAFVFACAVIGSSIRIYYSAWWQVGLEILGSFAVTALLARFIMNIFRGASKFFENIHYGKTRLYFPTTSMLLFDDNSISQDTKKRVRGKLKTKYNINLLSRTKETENNIEARRAAKDAVATIRQVVSESKRSSMLYRKLIRYGAFRNFLGGAFFCLPASILCWAIVDIHNMACLITIVLYIISFIVDYFLTLSSAVDYAETLIITFDKIENNEA